MQETRVPSLGRDDPLEEGRAAHSSLLAWRIPWTEESGGRATVHGAAESWTRLSDRARTHRCPLARLQTKLLDGAQVTPRTARPRGPLLCVQLSWLVVYPTAYEKSLVYSARYLSEGAFIYFPRFAFEDSV